MDQNMGIGKKIQLSFGNFEVYNVYIKQSIGSAILYLLAICILFSLIFSTYFGITFSSKINTLNEEIEKNIPNFSITDGILTVDSTKPIIFGDKSGYFVIDTTGSTKTNELLNYEKAFLIDSTSIHVISNSTIQSINFADMNEFNGINKGSITTIVNKIKVLVIILVFIFYPIFLFLINLLLGLTITPLMGLIINVIAETKLNYADLIRISIYALTVPILLMIVINCLGLALPFIIKSAIYLLITGVYMYLGMRSLDDMAYHV